jgi:hypothetical protein
MKAQLPPDPDWRLCMSSRRPPRIVIVLAGVLPLVLALWGPVGARAAGAQTSCARGAREGVNPLDCCRLSAGTASTNVDCGGPATHFIFSTEPGGANTNAPLNPQPVVEAVDDQNNVDTFYDQVVTLSIGSNPGGGTLGGTVAVTAVAGVATYTDLSINQPGVGYTLLANGPDPTRGVQAASLTQAESTPFDITQTGPAPASCDSIYAVTDGNTNSRFFKVGVSAPNALTTLGGVHLGTNFEGIEVDPQDGSVYATTATSNKHGQKGMFFQVDGLTGALTPLFSTGFKDVEGLAFAPDDTLYAWVDGKGLITIDIGLAQATLVLPSRRHFEALAWSNSDHQGESLYLAKNRKLWTFDPFTNAFTLVASNLPGSVLGMDVNPADDLLLGVAKQQKILVWDPVTKTTIGSIATPGQKPIQSLAQSESCQING